MHSTFSSLLRCTGLACAGAALTFSGSRLHAASTTKEADAFPTYDSYIKVSGETPFITGDTAAFRAQNGTNANGTFGIEDLFISKDYANDVTVKVKGHAMDGSEDYLGDVTVSKEGLGSVDFGYKRYRTFYDGVGGFFPLANTFQRMSQENLHVDRGALWFDAKIGKADGPQFKLSYHDEIRTGRKDSTEWGATINPDATITKGALVGTAIPTNTPYISPNVQNLDEHHDILEASFTDTVGKTTETLRATMDWVNNADGRSYVKYPNSTVIVDPAEAIIDDQETTKTHSFRILNQTETKFNDVLALETGLTYFHLSGEDGGQWITPAYNAGAKAVFATVTAGNIFANPTLDDYVGNVFLKLTPGKDWLAEVGFRDEYNAISDSGGFTTVALAATAKNTSSLYQTTSHDVTYSHEIDHVQTPEISLQYLGIKNVSIYGEFDDRTNKGNQHWINPYAAVATSGTGVVTMTPTPIGSVFFQDANQDNQDAKLGANWNVSSMLTIRAEFSRKDHQNRFIGANDYVGTASYGALYATGYTLSGETVSVIVKPISQLSFNTRYQQQDGNMSVTSNAVTGGLGYESPAGKASIKMLSETVDWTPYKQIYVQANVNMVYDQIQTTYPVVTVNAANSVAVPFVNADNDYITGSALCGFAADKNTDIQIQGFWERSNNYNPQVAAGGIPYGASFEISSITIGVKHKFTDRIFGEAKVGELKSTDGTTGSMTNYHGPLAYLSLTYAL